MGARWDVQWVEVRPARLLPRLECLKGAREDTRHMRIHLHMRARAADPEKEAFSFHPLATTAHYSAPDVEAGASTAPRQNARSVAARRRTRSICHRRRHELVIGGARE